MAGLRIDTNPDCGIAADWCRARRDDAEGFAHAFRHAVNNSLLSKALNHGRAHGDRGRAFANRHMLGTNAQCERLANFRTSRFFTKNRQNQFIVCKLHTGITIALKTSKRNRQHIHARVADEAGNEAVAWAMIQFKRRTNLRDVATFKHNDTISHGHGFNLIMRHIDHCCAKLLVQLCQFDTHIGAKRCIKV